MSMSREDARTTRRGAWSGLDQSSIMGVELLSATLTWAAIGWLVDRWLGTAPWFLAIGALLGNAAGIYLIWLRGARMDAADSARAELEAAAATGAVETADGDPSDGDAA
jgi:F0F1-type ATP synthase assembly protein I